MGDYTIPNNKRELKPTTIIPLKYLYYTIPNNKRVYHTKQQKGTKTIMYFKYDNFNYTIPNNKRELKRSWY